MRNNPLLYTDPLGLWKRVYNDEGIYYESEKGDTLSSLAKILGVSTESLVKAFGTDKVAIGEIYDVGFTDQSFANFRRMVSELRSIEHVDIVEPKISYGYPPIPGLGGLSGRVTGLLGTARMNLLNAVTNPTLKRWIEYLYRAQATVGNGSTADAIRYERSTGVLLSPAGHSIKGAESIRGIQKLINGGTLSGKDLEIAKQIVTDLTNALK